MLGPVSVAYAILSFHCTCGLAQGLEGSRSESRDVNPPEDVARWEAKNAFHEKAWAQKERELAYNATHWAAKGQRVHTSLDHGPPVRGRGGGDNSSYPILPTHNSFPAR
jgi:hypothetical protein